MPADLKAHEITLAIWDIPSPIAVSGRFAVKAGVRCSEGCPLNGQEILIRHPADTVIGRGNLGAEPWPGTAALYWTDLNLVAPAAEGTHVWDVTFVSANSEPLHGLASSRFSFITVPPAEHSVEVKIVDKSTDTTVGDVDVRFGMYRCHVGESGLARVELPKGCYDLVVYKLGYQAHPRTVEISADATVEIEIQPEPEIENYWR